MTCSISLLANFSQKEIGEPILDTVLEAGDMLYFPRGMIHQVIGLCTVAGLAGLTCLAGLTGLVGFAGLNDLVGLASLAGLNSLSGRDK